MTGIDNCWCQKLQWTGIPCDHLLVVSSFRRLITLCTLIHIIPSSITLTHGLVIGVDMTIDEIDQCTMVRSLGQIQQKSTKKGEGKYTFQWLWMKWRVISTGCQLEVEVELVPADHDLDYQCVYIFYCYIYQNNWI
jgi:hypothetical protein